MDKTFRQRVFEAVSLIPEGRVGTYAQVAELAGYPGAARAVGNAIHTNDDPVRVPCHRVVHSDGSLGANYGLGGPEAQRRRLEAEGVVFVPPAGEPVSAAEKGKPAQSLPANEENPAFPGDLRPCRVDILRCGIVFEEHPLQPFLPENAELLFLGSFPPPRARWSMEFFYPNFQNDFWRIQGLIHFGEPQHFVDAGVNRFDIESITGFCRRKGLAFFDTASKVCRLKGNASDEFLVILKPVDLSALLSSMPSCHTVVTTGGKSSEEFAAILGALGAAPQRLPAIGESIALDVCGREIRWWRMPSSSRAYPMSLARKAEYYSKLF